MVRRPAGRPGASTSGLAKASPGGCLCAPSSALEAAAAASIAASRLGIASAPTPPAPVAPLARPRPLGAARPAPPSRPPNVGHGRLLRQRADQTARPSGASRRASDHDREYFLGRVLRAEVLAEAPVHSAAAAQLPVVVTPVQASTAGSTAETASSGCRRRNDDWTAPSAAHHRRHGAQQEAGRREDGPLERVLRRRVGGVAHAPQRRGADPRAAVGVRRG